MPRGTLLSDGSIGDENRKAFGRLRPATGFTSSDAGPEGTKAQEVPRKDLPHSLAQPCRAARIRVPDRLCSGVLRVRPGEYAVTGRNPLPESLQRPTLPREWKNASAFVPEPPHGTSCGPLRVFVYSPTCPLPIFPFEFTVSPLFIIWKIVARRLPIDLDSKMLSISVQPSIKSGLTHQPQRHDVRC